jgi:hypothetical protein
MRSSALVFIPWVQSWQLFRPNSLARYMALSAFRNKVSGSSPSFG